ncbi:hypothetical protein [Halomontanus rarus]|uniref:hypothetical protein n=1 Tax=Halomontanus rarus TaxID=3034020 RepID=UPI0023E8AD2A|nr:hypothetical protein [Halovivax sp. TS33]
MSPTFTDDDVGKTVENANGEEVGVVAAIDGNTARVDPDPGITDSIKAALGWESGSEDTLTLQGGSVAEITGNVVYLEGESLNRDATDGRNRDTVGERRERDAGRSSGEPMSSDPEEADREVDTETDTSAGTGTDTETGTDIGTNSRGEPQADLVEEMGGADEMHPTEEMGGADEMDTVEEMDPVEGRDRGAEIDPTELEGTDPNSSTGTVPDDTRRTDAEIGPDEEMRHTDAELEPDDESRRTDAEIEPEGDVRRSDAEIDPEAIRKKATRTWSERETVDTDDETDDDWDRMEDDDSSEESRDDTGDGRDSDHTVTKDRSREDN